MKQSKVSTSVHYANFFYGRIRASVMDDFGTLVPLNFYDLAISINSYRTDFSRKENMQFLDKLKR